MFIYKIENQINHKVYIGATTRQLLERIKQHVNGHEKSIIHKALVKYGTSNFKIKIIDRTNTREEMAEKEKYWIKYYDSTNNGYNIANGGEGCLVKKGYRLSLEHRKKLSDSHKGKKLSDETREKMKGHIPWNKNKRGICITWNQGFKGRGICKAPPKCFKKGHVPWITGGTHSFETRKKLSKKLKGKKCSDTTRRKISIALQGKNTWTKGRVVSQETRKKLSISAYRQWQRIKNY